MTILWSLFVFFPLVLLVVRYLLGKPFFDGSLLLFGLTYYISLPFFVYAIGGFANGPGAKVWHEEMEGIYTYSGVCMVIILAFIVAFLLGKTLKLPNVFSSLNRPIGLRTVSISGVILVFLWVYFAHNAQAVFFSGYHVTYDPALLGPLATVNLIALQIFLNLRQWKQSTNIMCLYGVFLAINSFLLLSAGCRIYVLVVIVSLFLQQINSYESNKLSRIRIFLYIICALIVLLSVGIWRVGAEFDVSKFIDFALAESLLTSISMAYLKSCHHIYMFDIPYNFMSTIFNFVPSFIYPDKAHLMIELDRECVMSPFGAINVTVPLLLNFGYIGAFFIIFVFSILLKALRKVDKNGWWFYYYVCGLLPFTLFRDGFSIFNKAAIGSGLLVAIIIVFFSRVRLK